MTRRWSAFDLIDRVADPDSFVAWDDELTPGDPLAFTDVRSYVDRLRAARVDAGTSEAVLTGAARLRGRDVVLVVGVFEFLAGTQGTVVGERVSRAFQRAATLGLPVVGMPASGGTRMQEGALAFVQMLKIAASVAWYQRSGGRYVAWLRHPTTGGALASWGSLAQITWGQPGALIGLTGPRVIEQVYGEALPEHVQRSEHLCDHGVIDEVVTVEQVTARLSAVLDTLGAMPPRGGDAVPWPSSPVPPSPLSHATRRSPDAWVAVTRSRRGDRPGLPALLADATRHAVPLRGDGAGGRDDGCVTVLCSWRGRRVMVIGHDRRPGERGASLGAVGYRTARRALAIADELGLPIVTIVDTRGAAATAAAESGGVAAEIARCMATLSTVAVPTLAVLLGEGSGGGAIAWLATDHVVAAEHAWLAPIAPEGASAILYRTTDRAPELARAQAIDTGALRWMGLVDDVVPEAPGWITTLADLVADRLLTLASQPSDARRAARIARLRGLCPPSL